MTVVERAVAPTPKFFRMLRAIGIILTAIAAAALGIETVPEVVADVASYVAVAGTVLTAVSQVTVDEKEIGRLTRLANLKNQRRGK